MKKSLKNDGSNIDLDPDLRKKYEMSPVKYSTMNVVKVVPQMRSSKKLLDSNSFNIMATIPK